MGIGRVQNDMQDCIQSFLEAFPLFLVFSAQTKPNKTLHLNVIVANSNNKNKKISMLKYTFLIQTGLIIFVFFFTVETVEVFEAIQHILTRNATRAGSEEGRLFLQARRVACRRTTEYGNS